jgi:DNA (cytosine-5)-methyltransferase 1
MSSAGKRDGFANPKSGLWREYARIVGELRPRWIVVENVASGKSRWLPTVRRDLWLLGYDSSAIALSARDCGAPYWRRRIFIIAYPIGERLRIESRWSGGANGPGPAEPGDDGETGLAASVDPDGDAGRDPADALQPGREWTDRDAIAWWWQQFAPRDWWHDISGVRRILQRVSPRMDRCYRRRRIRALGDCVVPQCAEVIGRMLMEAHPAL